MGSAPTGRTTANTPRAAFEVKTEETRTGSRSTSETSLITTSGTAPTSTMSAAAVEVGSPVPLERNSRVEEIEEKEVEEITEIVDNMKIAETAPADPEKVMKTSGACTTTSRWPAGCPLAPTTACSRRGSSRTGRTRGTHRGVGG